MADSDLMNRNARKLDESDPFAELTRIMRREPEPQPEADAYDLDLEGELFSDEPSLAPNDDWGAPSHARSAAPQDDQYAAPAGQPALWNEPQNLDGETAREDGGWSPRGDLADQPAADEPVAYGEPYEDDFAAALDAGFEVEDDPAHAAYAPQATQDDDLGWEAAPVGEAPAAPVQESRWEPDDRTMAEVDMDFGDLDFSADEERPEADFEDDSLPASAQYAEPAESPAYAPVAEGPGSLEDELAMLLESDDDAPLESDHDMSPAAAGGDDSLDAPDMRGVLGRANYSAIGVSGDAGQADEPSAGDQPYEHGAEDAEAGWQTGDRLYAPELSQPDHLAASDDFDGYEPQEPVQAEQHADPFAAFARMTPPAHQPQPAYTGDGDDLIDTVDVPEPALAVADDLDIPEPAYEDAGQHGFDTLDAEFDRELELLDGRPEQPAAHAAAAGAADSEDDDRFFADLMAVGAAGAAAQAARPQAAADNTAYHSGESDDFTPAQTYAAAPAGDARSAGRSAGRFGRRPSGVVIAGVIVGIALLGGIGAFALSFGGGDKTDEPALVRADSDPIKVRPTDPGGETAPNQESSAYDAVSGGTAAAPSQETLVDSSEEPVDLAARGAENPEKAEDRLEAEQEAPGVGADADLLTVQPRRVRTMIVRPDGTLVPRPDPEPGPVQPQSSLSTDGPLADPQPAVAENVAAPAADAIRNVVAPSALIEEDAPATTGPSIPEVATAPEPEPEVIVEEPAAEPAAPQPENQVAQVAPRVEPQVQSSTGGEWSMQIASQPTAESAQASYQDLARRYGNIIGERGVNIVRADIPGKGTYYRVRIPSQDRAEAIQLCERFKAAGGNCFVSK